MSLEEKIASIVKALRKEHGITQEELAYRAELSIDALRKLESGKHLSRIDTIFKLTKAFGNNPESIYVPLWTYWSESQANSDNTPKKE